MTNLDVHPSDLHPRPGDNPNVLTPAQCVQLRAAIKKFGFLQPVLARRLEDGALEIIDGHHRVAAAIDVGLATVSVVVVDADEAVALAESLSMNRLRGETDLSIAADALRDLRDFGWTVPEMTVTGFSDEEVEALLKQARADVDDLGDLGGNVEDEGESVPQKRYTLRLSFDREVDRDRVRLFALNNGPTIEAGILNIAGKGESS